MSNKRYSIEKIISNLRAIEIMTAQGKGVNEACREVGITSQTYYRWRKEYGGMQTSQAKKLKELEKENARLRKAVSDLTLDKQILKELSEGKL